MRRRRRWLSELDFRKVRGVAARRWGDLEELMLLLMFDSGLRISEAAAVRWCDLHPNAYAVDVRRGKGGKPRRAWISVATRELLMQYPPAWRRSQATIWRLSIRTLRRRVAEACRRAGVPYCNPHGLRHSFATHALEGEIDPITIKHAMGHSRLAVTEIYTHPRRGPMRQIAERMEKSKGRRTDRSKPSHRKPR
jgi:integrase